jgi:hypothetical protein
MREDRGRCGTKGLLGFQCEHFTALSDDIISAE